MGSNRSALFFGAIVVAVISLILLVYYATPGVYHVLVSSDPMGAHIKHVALFAVLTVVCVIAALVTRPQRAR